MSQKIDTYSCCLYNTFVSKPSLSHLISTPTQLLCGFWEVGRKTHLQLLLLRYIAISHTTTLRGRGNCWHSLSAIAALTVQHCCTLNCSAGLGRGKNRWQGLLVLTVPRSCILNYSAGSGKLVARLTYSQSTTLLHTQLLHRENLCGAYPSGGSEFHLIHHNPHPNAPDPHLSATHGFISTCIFSRASNWTLNILVF